MSEILSVRINKQLNSLIRKHVEEFHGDQADIVRKLLKEGSIFIAIQGYASGQYSTEKAASLSGLPLAEFIDLLISLGIRSKLELTDLLDAESYFDALVSK